MTTPKFRVKNYEQFQHYKDRSPPWIKLYNSTLDDYAFTNLPDASRSHLIAIWLLASRLQNAIPFDAEWVTRAIKASETVDLAALEAAGFIIVERAKSVKSKDKHASKPLAPRKQDARPEREGETEERQRKEDQPAIAGDDLGPSLSDEEEFWSLEPTAAKVGITRSRLGQLVKLSEGNHVAALAILKAALRAKTPSSYLAKTAANLRNEQSGAPPPVAFAVPDDAPDFVRAAAAEGVRVEKHPSGWKIKNFVYDELGMEVGW